MRGADFAGGCSSGENEQARQLRTQREAVEVCVTARLRPQGLCACRDSLHSWEIKLTITVKKECMLVEKCFHFDSLIS